MKRQGHRSSGSSLNPKRLATRAAVGLAIASAGSFAQDVANRPQDEQRLSFQASDQWNPRVNVNADVAMAYGIDESLPRRLATARTPVAGRPSAR